MGTFHGKAGCSRLQTFAMQKLRARRYWRWYTVSRHSQWQGWILKASFSGVPEDVTASTSTDIVGHAAGHNSDEEWEPVTPKKAAPVVVKVHVSPLAAAAMLVCAMVVLGVWALRRLGCRGDKRYSKVSYVSDTEAEENAVFNGGEEEL